MYHAEMVKSSPMNRPNVKALLPLLLLIQLSTGCAPKTTLRAPSAAAVDSLPSLRAELERTFSDANFASAQWGVEILSLDRGDTLFERNSGRLYMPASNNKVVTTAAALARLGPDFRYETKVLTDGKIAEGILRGNLIVVGAGDPSNAARFWSGDPFHVFTEWAAKLKALGISAVAGDLVGDDSAFQAQELGTGWEWDDLAYGYAAPVSALQFNENLATVEITPGSVERDPVKIRVSPLEKYFTITCHVLTGAAGTESQIEFDRGESGETLTITGSIPAGGKPLSQTVAVRYPARYYLEALKQSMTNTGIDVSRCGIRAVRGAGQQAATVLWTHASPRLAEIIKPLLKVSQNLYAETLTRTMGNALGKEGSFAQGKSVIEEALTSMAVPKGTYSYADGSGLSRLNLVSADMMVRILKYVSRQKYFPEFYEALPIAGVDGTISGRMKGTKAEKNVHAKTGSIAYVRALSGYIRTANGEMLVFSMLANNFLAPSRNAEYVMDTALEILANFQR
jgi:serine-type D-Ala-D-Ala carboxypeptidase/endopeptidase (penicillin-binding protein 4)